jgi:hypothetical protein
MQDKQDMLKDLARRYHKASMELLSFSSMPGVSERFRVELGLLQMIKTANTIFNMIEDQEKRLDEAINGADDKDVEGGASPKLTEDKRHVQRAGDRVLLRALQHVENAMDKIQGSRIYTIETSQRAKELKVQQRRVSAFKIVEKLADLRDKLVKKRANLAMRAQKIVLSPGFQEFRSRSRSPYAKSRSRSRSAKSRSHSATSRRSAKSPSVQPPGRWTFIGEDEEGVFEPLSPSAKASVDRRFPYPTRVRLGYNF